LKINSLLAGILGLVLVAGLGTPVFAEPPLDSDSTVLSQQVFVTSGDTTINFDALTQQDILVGNEFAGQGVVFLTPDLNLEIGQTATGGSLDNALGANLNQLSDFSGEIVIFLTDNNCASDLQFFIFNEPYSANAFDVDGNVLATLNDGDGTVLGLGEVFSFAGMQVQKVETSGTIYAIDDVSFTLEECIVDNDNDGSPEGEDCDDNDPNNFPGNTETCDGQDNNCDGMVDEGLGQTTCGVGECIVIVDNCLGGANQQQCIPGTPESEVCDGLDNNCDGTVDDGLMCEPPDDGQVPVGGELIPIETTSLILAGAQSFSWMIPVILSGIGIGLFVVSRKFQNS